MQRIDPVLLLFSAAVLAVTIQKGIVLAHPGNFLLFRDTFHRLVSGADVYNPPAGEMTGFLYSPTFALLFAPFALLPLALGLLLWNGINALTLYWGVTRVLPARAARVALLIVFLDMLRSLQNSQTNALMAGVILLSFVALERERVVGCGRHPRRRVHEDLSSERRCAWPGAASHTGAERIDLREHADED